MGSGCIPRSEGRGLHGAGNRAVEGEAVERFRPLRVQPDENDSLKRTCTEVDPGTKSTVKWPSSTGICTAPYFVCKMKQPLRIDYGEAVLAHKAEHVSFV